MFVYQRSPIAINQDRNRLCKKKDGQILRVVGSKSSVKQCIDYSMIVATSVVMSVGLCPCVFGAYVLDMFVSSVFPGVVSVCGSPWIRTLCVLRYHPKTCGYSLTVSDSNRTKWCLCHTRSTVYRRTSVSLRFCIGSYTASELRILPRTHVYSVSRS